jgi:hypothetical protein
MSDVNTFIDAVGHDVNTAVVPRVQDLVTAVIQDLFQRYRPEIAGELHANFVNGCVELTGHGIRLDLNRRDTGASVASLDIPVSLQIRVDELTVKLQNTPIRFDVVR